MGIFTLIVIGILVVMQGVRFTGVGIGLFGQAISQPKTGLM